MSIICAFQFNVEVERGALRSLIGGMSNRFPGNRVSRDRPVLPLPLRRQNGSKLCFKGIPRVAAVASSEDLRRGGGTNLAEVYAVRIDDIDGESPGELYGKVCVKDLKNTHTIYDRDRETVESIRPGENALLIGPSIQAILASEKFSIEVGLFDKHSDSSANYDKEISKGEETLSFDNNLTQYDALLTAPFKGENGSATVSYAVLKNAVQASVEVTMIGDSKDDPVEVYGDITASNTKIKNIDSVLFRETLPGHVSVSPGKPITLARSIVAVPLDSELIVNVNYKFYDTDEVIANEAAKFPAQPSDTSEKKIYGNSRNFHVKVTWSAIK